MPRSVPPRMGPRKLLRATQRRTQTVVFNPDWKKLVPTSATTMQRLPARDHSECTTLTVHQTLLVRGKHIAQDEECSQLAVLDLATLRDTVITGNQEVDGTSLFHGPVEFRSPVHLAVPPWRLSVACVLPTTDQLRGPIRVATQLNWVDITWELTNVADVPWDTACVAFRIDAALAPALPVCAWPWRLGTDASVVFCDATPWLPQEARCGHCAYLRPDPAATTSEWSYDGSAPGAPCRTTS